MKRAAGFLLLAALAGALLVITQRLTAQRIANNQLQREAALLAELLGGTTDPTAAERLCRTRVRGYAGHIELWVLPTDASRSTLSAVRVADHRETPGIGDFIERKHGDWMLGFAGLSVTSDTAATQAEWNATLDAVSGATITRRAVITGVANACPPEASGTDPLFRDPEQAQ